MIGKKQPIRRNFTFPNYEGANIREFRPEHVPNLGPLDTIGDPRIDPRVDMNYPMMNPYYHSESIIFKDEAANYHTLAFINFNLFVVFFKNKINS